MESLKRSKLKCLVLLAAPMARGMRIESNIDVTNEADIDVCDGVTMPNGDCVNSCPAGNACRDGEVIPCESGTFSTGGEVSECTACDDGDYCPAESPIPYKFPDHLFK